MYVLLYSVLAFALSVALTPMVRAWGRHSGIVDRAESAPERKFQKAPVPLNGGIAIFGAFVLTILAIWIAQPHLLFGGYLLHKHIIGILVGGAVLMVFGMVDARKALRPRTQLVWTSIAALVVLAAGIGIQYVSNPLGNTLHLDQWMIQLFTLHNTPYSVILPADLLAFLWILGSMYATKLLDGLDGLVSGVAVIGMVILFALSMLPNVGQPETALLALVGAGAFAGFLVYNFTPASIYLGEGGATFAGFLLGTLAIISGGKIATALLILGFPILDVVWVIIRRLFHDKTPLGQADRKHLHFRLVDMGMSVRQAVLLFYLCIAVFGSSTLFFHGKAKLLVLILLAVAMVAMSALTVIFSRRKARQSTLLDSRG